mmetsp:Transcript_26720/g.46310  ORF Transcript_26720/g.46310 Transcript_26720/m.46310 type:complete len:826 (+) Transcript_26720:75-2552(+)
MLFPSSSLQMPRSAALRAGVLRPALLLLASTAASTAPLAAAKGRKRASAQELLGIVEFGPASQRADMPQRAQVAPWELRKNLADPSGTPQMPLPDPNEEGSGKSSGLPANTEFRQPTNGSTPTGWIQLGTPPKWLLTIFDTGSDKLVAKTWDTVSTELATMDQGISGMVLPADSIYNHGNSSSYRPRLMPDPLTGKLEPMQSQISYGSGTAFTDEGNETVLVGGQSLENFSLSEVTADTLSLLHTKKGVSGVLGLQHMKNQSLGSSLFSRMRDMGLMTGFGYCRGKNNSGTFIWNDQSTEGVEIPVVGEMHWAVALGGVKVNASETQASASLLGKREKSGRKRGRAWPFSDDSSNGDADAAATGGDGGSFGSDGSNGDADPFAEDEEAPEVDLDQLAPHLCPDFKCTAILDTGSNIIAGPTEALKGLTSLVNVKSDCSNFEQLPDISMTLGHVPVVVKPAGYVMKLTLPKISDGWMDDSDSTDAGEGSPGTSGNSKSAGDGSFGGEAAENSAGGDVADSWGGSNSAGSWSDDSNGGVRGVHSKQKMGLEINGPMLPGLHEHGQDFRIAGLAQGAGGRARKSRERQAARQWEAFFAHAVKEYGVDLRTALHNVVPRVNLTDVTEVCMPALVPLDKKTKFGPLWVVGTPLLETTYARWSWHRNQESPSIHLKALGEAKVCEVTESPAAQATRSTGAESKSSSSGSSAPSRSQAPAAGAAAAPAGSASSAPAVAAAAPAAASPAGSPSGAPSFPLGLMRSEQRILAAAAAAADTLPLVSAVEAALGANVDTAAVSQAPQIYGQLQNSPVERQLDEIIYPHWAKNLLEV